jgi:broad specificity phosphatase PhoE
MTTSVYLVRHGQTAWNKEEVFRGRTDIPLDETGLREAELAAEYFKSIHLQAVYSSPLSRAWQTARKIGQFHPLEVQSLDGIIDMSFGRWEGHPLREVEEKDGNPSLS